MRRRVCASSLRWSARRRKTWLWSSARTAARVRVAAITATARASTWSVFRPPPVSSSRTCEVSVEGTSTTHSPAATSCCASRYPSPLAPSIAHARSGQPSAHVSRSRVDAVVARTRIVARSPCVAFSIAEAVWVDLCGSMPIVTVKTRSPSQLMSRLGPRRAT